ncbi:MULTISPECIES: hypothetical protein [unclassified Paenibacillus]|uniref:hypothetical protein n=1 Tax=unclassified Paenibacillus TaxID=185978 RepID=UPI0024059AA5|nr:MULTISPECIES: hypothetical protein [unclassified Paenibacillus]MDF9841835.1 hypothetical protein [Paenibacillus sp. PastF-2]MDF9848484.1 hypothetical protein [Paenibacillus sp. PastM-2]MDF9854995.1 hypothetical protein [Paenibacillus sp. PastF-1]MDH6480264.1 hypothetical protein [Paenibacillus sp. PastH-2]MDH6507752.1 hypothetical protein [Paenibacillus sp. PastM-3]
MQKKQAYLNKEMEEKGVIKSTEIDEENNVVYAYVEDLSALRNNIFKDDDAVEYKQQELSIKFTASEVINGNGATISGNTSQ